MQTSGFFNAQKINGLYDREYNADHYSDNLAVVISDGVLRSSADDLKPSVKGMTATIGIGRAWIRGKWYKNDVPYSFTIPTAPTTNPRMDRIVLRYDNSREVRNISLQYLTGTPSMPAEPPAAMDTDTIKDLVICDIFVNVNATSAIYYDRRADKNFCGWVYSVKGDDEFFESLDGAFTEWFEEKKDTLSSVTLFKKYVYRTTTTSAGQTQVSFDIPQYDPNGVDIIDVFFNGRMLLENEDYTLNGSVITFKTGKSANQEVVVVCYKSIDGTGLGSVVGRIDELEQAMATLEVVSEFDYICNGINDNVKLSQLMLALHSKHETTDFAQYTIKVHGNFGCSAPVAGSGASDDEYKWFKFDDYTYTTNKVILDFSNCSKINITAPNNTVNRIFYGYNIWIKNARIFATVGGTTGAVTITNGSGGKAVFERCTFELTGCLNTYMAARGEWIDCRTIVINTNGASFCWYTSSYSFIKVNGGEHYAYAVSGKISAVFGLASDAVNGVLLVNGASCPTLAKGSYIQSYAVYDPTKNGKCAYNNLITALPISAEGQFVTGTIPQSKVDYL